MDDLSPLDEIKAIHYEVFNLLKEKDDEQFIREDRWQKYMVEGTKTMPGFEDIQTIVEENGIDVPEDADEDIPEDAIPIDFLVKVFTFQFEAVPAESLAEMAPSIIEAFQGAKATLQTLLPKSQLSPLDQIKAIHYEVFNMIKENDDEQFIREDRWQKYMVEGTNTMPDFEDIQTIVEENGIDVPEDADEDIPEDAIPIDFLVKVFTFQFEAVPAESLAEMAPSIIEAFQGAKATLQTLL